MDEQGLRAMVAAVKSGAMTRREVLRRLAAVGLTAPMAAQMLAWNGVAMAQNLPAHTPTRRGGGGTLKVLWWQGTTLLNPHFANGSKDQEGSRIFYEPLAAWDPDGNLVPYLAERIPSLEDGSLSPDGMSVTWKLKRGVTWHDGAPFTADDVVFNWEYSRDPATSTVTHSAYANVTVEKIDSHTVKVIFKRPTPFWADAFVGARGMIIPKHLFKDYMGARSREAPANLRPVGTGAYRFVEFKPGDLVRGVINTDYHEPNRPYFDAIEMKGGGDAVSAARAVMQTAEFDYAWNVQVEDEILKRLEASGKGRANPSYGGNVEFIALNPTDPWTEVDGERSSVKTTHPSFGDRSVRLAMAHLVDRKAVEDNIYGRTGLATTNFLNNPPRYRSKNTDFAFSIDKANQILDAAGWQRGSDGLRAKGGVKLRYVFQTSTNAPRQKTQVIVKAACQKAGIDIEIKSVVGGVFFSSDVANPDTFPKFYADMQMYTSGPTQPDPEVFMQQFCSWEIANKDNKWSGRNCHRYRNAEYDTLFRAAQNELDPVKRAAMFIRMNDILVTDPTIIPVVYRPLVGAISNRLTAVIGGWDNELAHLRYWHHRT